MTMATTMTMIMTNLDDGNYSFHNHEKQEMATAPAGLLHKQNSAEDGCGASALHKATRRRPDTHTDMGPVRKMWLQLLMMSDTESGDVDRRFLREKETARGKTSSSSP